MVAVTWAAVAAAPRHRASCGCGRALATAVVTAREEIPARTQERLGPILDRWLQS